MSYSLVVTKIILAARGPICDALPEEAVNKAFLIRKMPKLRKLEWRHTGSPKRLVSVVIVQIAKILLAARGPICHELPKDAVDPQANKVRVEPHWVSVKV